MLDSGTALRHPHISRPVVDGVTIGTDGETVGFEDNLGHGTAVCALLQKLAPDADLLAVKIFDRKLSTSLSVVLRAIDWCLEQQVDLINLSLGTSNRDHLPQFTNAIHKACDKRSLILSAYKSNDTLMLPGSLPSVIGVVEDVHCPRENARVIQHPTPHVAACPYPLDIPGIPRERNLRGVSFAVAHVTAQVARIWRESNHYIPISSTCLEQISLQFQENVPSEKEPTISHRD
jgi:hypothetical protein